MLPRKEILYLQELPQLGTAVKWLRAQWVPKLAGLGVGAGSGVTSAGRLHFQCHNSALGSSQYCPTSH